jgi:hypothetical protein
MKPRWDPSGTILDAFQLAGRLTVRGYVAEGSYIFREAAVPLEERSQVRPALEWWSKLSSTVVSKPDRELGAQLHNLAVSLVKAGHRGEAVRVLTMALRHLPGRYSNLAFSSPPATPAVGTASVEIVTRLSEEALTWLRRRRPEGVTLLAAALRVGGATMWSGEAVREAVSALPELRRGAGTPLLLRPLARNAYKFQRLGLNEPAIRMGMLIPKPLQFGHSDLFPYRNVFGRWRPESYRVAIEVYELSEELRRKGYLPEAADLAATALDLGYAPPDVGWVRWGKFEKFVLPQTGVRLTSMNKMWIGAAALSQTIWRDRMIVASRLPSISALLQPGKGEPEEDLRFLRSVEHQEYRMEYVDVGDAGIGGRVDDLPSPTEPERPDGERAINAWLTRNKHLMRPPLKLGVPYILSFSVGAPVAGSLLTSEAAKVPDSDVPSEGLKTWWTVRSKTVELLHDLSSDASVDVEGDRSGGWMASFSLHIPDVGESEVRRLVAVPRAPDAKLEVVIFAKADAREGSGEIERFEEYRRLTLDLSTAPGSAPQIIASDVCLSPMGQLGLWPAHEWMTPPGTLSVSTGGVDAIVKGTLVMQGGEGPRRVEHVEAPIGWDGADPRAAGTIEQLRNAAEAVRTQCETYLNDIDPSDLAARLRAFTPEYDWGHTADDADNAHKQAWTATADSQELFDVAFYGHQLYNIFFPHGSKLRTWLDALVPGHRIDITWFERSGPAWRTHVPWVLMYQLEPIAGIPVDPMYFLGLRFRLGYVTRPHQGTKGLGAPDRAYQMSLFYWGSGANDRIAVEALWQRQVFQTRRQQVFFPADVESPSKSEIVGALSAPGQSPLAVLYLYCTCSVGKGNEPVLQFGATSAATDVVRQAELGSSQLVDRPLVFANACSTVAAAPYFTNELAMTFFDRGCRAFLGTEVRVPIQLASRFAYLFFQFFARQVVPEPVAAGEAVSQARLFLWRHYRNIGGLFYSYMASYELFFAADDEVVSLKGHR